MLADISWLAEQAKIIHATLQSWFFPMLTFILTLSVVIEYFKFPIGLSPSFGSLLGRAIVASILLYAYPEISNAIADISDAISSQLGNLNDFNTVLAKMGEKLKDLTWSWISFKDSIIGLLSYLSFFVLYISVFAVQAFMIFSWTLLYVFSPIMILLFVHPSTAVATKSLFRSLVEVSLWKVVWSVLATLLWSFALAQVNSEATQVNFLTAIFLNLILAGSLLLTPIVVHALAGQGISSLATTAGGIVAGATMGAPMVFANSAKSKVVSGYRGASNVGGGVIRGTQASHEFLSHRSRSFLKNRTKKSKGDT